MAKNHLRKKAKRETASSRLLNQLIMEGTKKIPNMPKIKQIKSELEKVNKNIS